MAINEWVEWRGEITFGRVSVPVAGSVALEGSGLAGELRVMGVADLAAWPRPAAHAMRWLRPRAGGERAYTLLAEALERTRLVALLTGARPEAATALWSLAGSLAVAPGAGPLIGEPPPEPTEEELLLARTLLLALPRRLPVAPAGAPLGETDAPAAPEPALGTVITLADHRRRRRSS